MKLAQNFFSVVLKNSNKSIGRAFTSHNTSCSCCGMFFCTRSVKSKTKLLTKGFTSDLDNGIDSMETLLKKNKIWAADINQNDPNFFNELRKGQSPKYLYFGCADSRVPPNSIFGLGPGEVFVHRNVGNLIPGNDLNCLSVLEYAVGQLGVTDIIVTGHYECGAVRAAAVRQDLGTLENWLRLIRDVYRLHRDEIDSISDPDDRHRKFVELNVIEQCLNVYKTGVVQRKRLKSKEETGGKNIVPRIHGTVFNPADGLVKKLNVDYEKRIGNLDHIYSLY